MLVESKLNFQTIKQRVITMLDREEIDYLDKLGKDAFFSTGHKLPYNTILKGLIDFAMEIGLTGENIDSLKSLKEKIFQQIKKTSVTLK